MISFFVYLENFFPLKICSRTDQQVKLLVTKPDNQSLIPETHGGGQCARKLKCVCARTVFLNVI